MVIRTLGYREKCQWDDGLAMSPLHAVVDIADEQVIWVKLGVSSRDRNCGLIGPTSDNYHHRPFSVRKCGNGILTLSDR
jgi:hypothetical protein